MRREPEYYGDQELVLLYIAKRLKEAQALEAVFDQAGIDYLVEPDTYRGGFIFVTERVGAFFYASDGETQKARDAMNAAGYKPYNPEE